MLVTRSCQSLYDPMDCSPSGSSVHGILQAEYWSRLTLLSPGNLPDPGIERGSPTLQADSVLSEPPNPLKILKSESLHKLLYQSWAIVSIQHKFPPQPTTPTHPPMPRLPLPSLPSFSSSSSSSPAFSVLLPSAAAA